MAGGNPTAKCPLRPGEDCHLCVPGAHGPHDCSTVWLVMQDPELRARLAELRRAEAGGRRAEAAPAH